MLQLGMHFDRSGGGLDRYFCGLLSGLTASGEDWRAIAFGDTRSTGLPANQMISLGGAGASLPKRLGAIRRALAGELRRQDALLVSHFALYAAPALALPKRRHIVHFHGPWAEESGAERQRLAVVTAKRMLERAVYRSADRFVTLSSAFRSLLASDYGISPDLIEVVPGGVDISRFRPYEREDARRRLGWPPHRRIILCVRRLVRRMGLENLLEAFAHIAASHPDAILFLAGRGPLAEKLSEQVRMLGLEERVQLLGFVSDDDLPLAYAAADFSVVPSEALEGFGLITLESLACGTPVLVTPVGGLPEAVEALQADLVMSSAAMTGIADGLARALRRPEKLPSREACSEYIRRNFAWPVIAKKVVEVYERARK